MTDLRTPPVNDGDLFCERVRQYAYERPLRRMNVLLAGCGWSAGPDLRSVDLGGIELHITGVDADTPALRARTETRDDLDTWHLGDLRTVPMPPRTYDVVCAVHVLERLAHAELVLDRIVAALKPAGLLLVRFRDRDTAYALLDRLVPPQVRGQHAPPVIYERIASYEGMRWYCGMRGLVIAEEHTVRSAQRGGRWSGVAAGVVEKVSGGRLTAKYSDVSLVIRKPENRFARVI